MEINGKNSGGPGRAREKPRVDISFAFHDRVKVSRSAGAATMGQWNTPQSGQNPNCRRRRNHPIISADRRMCKRLPRAVVSPGGFMLATRNTLSLEVLN